MTLNLKDPGDLELARELALTVDVLIENNRPGVMDRLGLGYEALKARNPRLVYCSISAYGQSGPRAQEGGFDLTIQAMSGIMSVTGEAGGEPVKCGVPLADFSAGLYGAFAIASALRAAQASGQGAHIDVPMLGATLGIAALQTSEFFGSGRDPVKLGSAHPRNAPYQAFRCKGGYFGMAAGNQALWKSVCEVVGRDDLLADARFADTSLRARNQRRAARDPGSHLRRRRGRVLAGALSRGGRPLRADQHLFGSAGRSAGRAHGLVQPLELPNGVRTRTFGLPVRFDGQTTALRRRPPALGEHNEEVLGALRAAQGAGMSDITETDGLRVERRGALHLLTLARPDKMNALSAGLVEALIAAVDRAQAEQARAIVFRARAAISARASTSAIGNRRARATCYCASCASRCCCSAWRPRLPDGGAGAWPQLRRRRGSVRRLQVAAGRAEASFRMPGLKFGLVLGTRRFAALVGAERARTILEQAATFDAEAALRDGFVSRLAKQDEWPAAADEALAVASALTDASRAQLYAALSLEAPDADLARLTRSAAEPGLKARVAAYLQAR